MGLDNSPLFFPFPSPFYSLFLPAMPPVSFSTALAQPGPVPPLPPPPLSSFSTIPQPLCPLTTPDPPSPFSLPSVAPFSQASPLATLPLGAGPPQAPDTYTLPPSSPMATPTFLPDLIGPPISPAALALASPMISPALKGAPSSSAPLSLVALAPSSAQKSLDASPNPVNPTTPGAITSLLTPANARSPIPQVASTSATVTPQESADLKGTSTPPDVVTALPPHLGIPLASESNTILQTDPTLPISIQTAPMATPSPITMAPKAPSAAFTPLLGPPLSHAEHIVSPNSGAAAQIGSDNFLKPKSPAPVTIPLGISSPGPSTSSTTLGSPVTLFPKDPLVSPVVSSSPVGSPFSLLMPPVQKDPSDIIIVSKSSSGPPFVATSPPLTPTYPLSPPVLSLGPKAPPLGSPSLKGTPTPVVATTQVAVLAPPTVTATVPISLEGGSCPLGSPFIPSDSADSKPKKDHAVLPTALPLSPVVPKDPSVVQVSAPSLKTPVSPPLRDLKDSQVVPVSPFGVSSPIQTDSPTKKVPITLPLDHVAPQNPSTCSSKSSPGSPSPGTTPAKKDLVQSPVPAVVPSLTILTSPTTNADNSTVEVSGTSKVPKTKIDLSTSSPLASPLIVPDSPPSSVSLALKGSPTTPAVPSSPQGLLFSAAQMDCPTKKNPATPLIPSPVAPKEITSTPAATLSPLEFALSSASPKGHGAEKGPMSPESPHIPSTVAISPLGASVTPQIPEVLPDEASSATIPASLTPASITPQSAPVASVLPDTTTASPKETSDSPGVATSPLEATVIPNRSPLAFDLASATPCPKGSPTSPLVTPPHKGGPTPPSSKRASTTSPALPPSAPKEAPTTPAVPSPTTKGAPTSPTAAAPLSLNRAPTTPPAAMPPSPKKALTPPVMSPAPKEVPVAMPPAPKEVPTVLSAAVPPSPKGAPTIPVMSPAPKEAPGPAMPSPSSKEAPSTPPVVPSSPKGAPTPAITTSPLEATVSPQVPKGPPAKKGSATSLSPKVTSDSSPLEAPVSPQSPKGPPAKKGSATSPAAAKGAPTPPAATSPSPKVAAVSPQTSKRSLPKKGSGGPPDLAHKEAPALSDRIPPPKDGPVPPSPKSASPSTVLTITPKGATNHSSEVVSPLEASVSSQAPKGPPNKKGSSAHTAPKSTPIVPTPKGPSAKKGHATSPLRTPISPAASPAPSTKIGTTGAPLGQKGAPQVSKGPLITEKEEGPASSSKDLTLPTPAPSSPLVAAASESNLTKAESASLSPAPIPPVSLLLVPSPVPSPLLPKQQPLLPSSPGLVPEAPCKPQAPADEDELPPLIPPEPPSGGVPFQPVLVDISTPKPTGVPAPVPPAKQPVLKNNKGIRLGLPCAWCVARTLPRATHQY
ncbi:nascent polypeptide-associated complex subunit alpha, muscle-specific form-like isoform X1 [Vombatus ursinus]|uniref:nascent polypeptide-associated complex subunit alpha, muscle-specific form-like isoform X1 n=1 Tax=Vombatus ursinus TaxID=29139 RepID=UPI000FFD55E9|nr:nascent polypeptide-associated complex subunit alpha, muscle-specific form-like isoform X1 [Vombatus ursinus]